MSSYQEVCKMCLENALEKICWHLKATCGLLWNAKYCGTKHKWHLLCSAKHWCFQVHTLGLRVTWTASTSLPAPFLHLVHILHTWRLGKQRKAFTKWHLGFLSWAVALTWKFVFLVQVVWCNIDFSVCCRLLWAFCCWDALSYFLLSFHSGMLWQTAQGKGWGVRADFLLRLWGPVPWHYLAFCGKSIFSLRLE